MKDLAISFGIWWAIIGVLCAIAVATKKAEVKFGWFILSIILFALSFLGNILGDALIPEASLFPSFDWEWNWNWSGKFGEIFATLLSSIVICFAARKAKWSDIGFTFKQNIGSLVPALWMMFILVGIGLLLNFVIPGDPPTKMIDTEQMLYQATMPGFSEELFYRGLLLFTLMKALPSKTLMVAGTPIGFGGFMTIVIFTIGHSLYFAQGDLQFSGIAAFYSAVMAMGLLWMRLRTGSVLLPLIADNLINTSTTFMGFFV